MKISFVGMTELDFYGSVNAFWPITCSISATQHHCRTASRL